MHVTSEPAILYFGTPVVIISTLNEDGTANLAPMSSAWWLGWRCMLGLAAYSKTTQNLLRTRECVLNLPSQSEVAAVDRLALTTGTESVPAAKLGRGYRYVKDKFGVAGLHPDASHTVAPPRVRECPVQLEAVLEGHHEMAARDAVLRGRALALEVRIQPVHLAPSILMAGHENRIDPDKWRPLIMSFQKFYGLAPHELHDSKLGRVPEETYRSPDVDRGRVVERG
ncbi:MAG TPA: flavin reductase family protein [Ramlibacter sp.]|uniref:flavin reductase family protein n=1 Tax=Ramlibacter sp. TaxID=1917967 RepID=UPI002CE0A34C|nr:flavin reductase family protein [Ramlibacter sp.]HVZ46227.1 flavin reductase family protein [Ramlibacter sp.]